MRSGGRNNQTIGVALVTITVLCAGPARALTGGPDAFGYTFADSTEPNGPAFGWIDITSTGTPLAFNGGDVQIPVGFTFRFYGEEYTDVLISQSGALYFVPSYTDLDAYPPACIPGGNVANIEAIVAPAWGNLDTLYGGTVYYEVQGYPPNRRLIIEWHGVYFNFILSTAYYTFDVILDERYGHITFQYQDMAANNAMFPSGYESVAGIQGLPTTGLSYSCGGAVLLDQLAIVFNPCSFDDLDLDGFSDCDGDCDDGDPSVYPAAEESCDDGIDSNCDGQTDEYADADGDGYSNCTGDCDDYEAASFPGNPELCDFIDNDCDGLIDEVFDADGDGFSTCAGDCDDADSNIYPGALELCDGIDNDCDGVVDEETDDDGDGWTICDGDCDDNDADTYPGAPELCDQVDNDCDGTLPAGETDDDDGDGWVDCMDCEPADSAIHPDALEVCDAIDNNCDGVTDEGFDEDGDGWSPCMGDCDDGEDTVHPGAPELCDEMDNDCDGALPSYEFDNDGDGFIECDECDDSDASIYPGAAEDCFDQVDSDCGDDLWLETDDDGDGISECDGDCDDDDPAVHPGAEELCNDGVDDDCNPITDENGDSDMDGVSICDGDCDDYNSMTHSGAPESCDGEDNDCDGQVDEGIDQDLDGYSGCSGEDCNDLDPTIHPGAVDVPYNAIDEDCDGADLTDLDGDGFHGWPIGGDCDDENPAINPGVEEVCGDDVDQDCDGVSDSMDPDCGEGGDGDGCVCQSTPRGARPGVGAWALLALVPWLIRRKPRRQSGGFGLLLLLSTGMLAVAGPALAQVDPVDPFTGYRSEGFETQQSPDHAPCVEGRVFDGTADLCAANYGGTLLLDQLEFTGWTCTLWPHEGGRFYTTEVDAARFTFDYPVLRFGGYFSGDMTPADLPLVSVEFFDDTGALIDSVTILQLDSNCGWTWYGWESLDTDIATIEVGYSNAWVAMDGLEVDFDCDDTDADGDGWSLCAGDCDDADPAINPSIEEVDCDGIDNDCSGSLPENEFDNDADGQTECEGDCDDTNHNILTGGTEIPYNGIDEDCDGFDLSDVDEDGYGGGVGGTDCDDNDPAINPAATEICDNGIDDNCDTLLDTADSDCDEAGEGDAGDTSSGCQCEFTSTSGSNALASFTIITLLLMCLKRKSVPSRVSVASK